MVGLDTNVLVRWLVRDDEAQYQRAGRLIRKETPFLSLLVLLETEWVLRSRYSYAKAELLGVFSALLEADDLRFEDEASLEQALYWWKESAADFSDCLIAARNQRLGCRVTATFDRNALQLPAFARA